MKIEITMTELLLIVDMIKNGIERTEPNQKDEDFLNNYLAEKKPEQKNLKKKKKK